MSIRERERLQFLESVEEKRQEVLQRVRTRYADFGPTLAAEYLSGEGLNLSKETLRQWMIGQGL
ncbi:MAG: hypothetical protein LBQ81_02430 [Zoogloeaceae bacterium]|jgi:hypothetical protein|nr:hypothetical protein [Zoogloeaceae bacterium]